MSDVKKIRKATKVCSNVRNCANNIP